MRPYVVRRDGSLELRLSEPEARALHNVAREILASMDTPEREEFRRLFPPAYSDDADREHEFAAMTRDDLVEHKRAAARAMLETIESAQTKRGVWTGRLQRSDVHAWTTTINDARLILGTRLDVSEDMDHSPRQPDDRDAAAFNLYLYLGGMQELLVEYLLEHDLGD